ncbi:MAG: MFS transporter [Bowdeniella nasicola]|nr:MFS transporter [Bowdeniella nasicola]
MPHRPHSPVPHTAYEQIDAAPLTSNQKSLIALLAVGNLSEFFDMFLIGFVVALLIEPWNLTGFEEGTLLACSGLATVLGAVAWGRIADSIGRRRALFWCILTFVSFTALTLLTPERGWVMIAVLRVSVGMGVGGLNITSIPYVQEFVPSTHRGLLAGLGSVFIPLGLVLGSVSQKVVDDNWRLLILLGCLPAVLLIWLRVVPESPRFHQVAGHENRARASLAWALELPLDEAGELPAPRCSPSVHSGLRGIFWRHCPPTRRACSSPRSSSS